MKNPKLIFKANIFILTVLFISPTLQQGTQNFTLSKTSPYFAPLNWKLLNKNSSEKIFGFVWQAYVLKIPEIQNLVIDFNSNQNFMGIQNSKNETYSNWGVSRCDATTNCDLGFPGPFFWGDTQYNAFTDGLGLQFRLDKNMILPDNSTTMMINFLNCSLEDSPFNNGPGYGFLGLAPASASTYYGFLANDAAFHWNLEIVSWRFWINNHHDGPNIEPVEGMHDGSQLIWNIFNERGRYYPLSFKGYGAPYFPTGMDWIFNKISLTTWNYTNPSLDNKETAGPYVIAKDAEICMNIHHPYIIGFKQEDDYIALLENMYKAICSNPEGCPTKSDISKAPAITLQLNEDDIKTLNPRELFYDDGAKIQPFFGIDNHTDICVDQTITFGRNFFNKFALYVIECSEPLKPPVNHLLWTFVAVGLMFLVLVIVCVYVKKRQNGADMVDGGGRKGYSADELEIDKIKRD